MTRRGGLARAAAWLRFHVRRLEPRFGLGVSVGETAFFGIAFATALSVAQIVVARVEPLAPPTERWIRTILAGYVPGVLFFAGHTLLPIIARPAPLAVIAALLVLLFWGRLRAARAVVHCALALFTWHAASCAALYAATLDPAGVLPFTAALVAVVALRAIMERRGLGLGRSPSARALRRLGGPAAAALGVGVVASTLAGQEREARSRTREDLRFAPDAAYDAIVVGAPPALVFTNQEEARIARAPYADDYAGSEPLIPGIYAERLIPSADPGVFYLAISAGGVRRISLAPKLEVTTFEASESLWTASLAEDPVAARLFVLNEWEGRGSIFSLDGREGTRAIDLSSHTWTVPWITVDASSRRAYVTSMLDDGGLRLLDLDTLEVRRSNARMFLYQSVVDHERGLLWATRPLPGEIVGVDLDTLEVRVRIPLAPGTRDVVFDPERRQLFVNTYPFGDLFRIDAATDSVLEVSGCGWRCRSLYLDAPRRTLWAASLGGIYRFPVDRAIP